MTVMMMVEVVLRSGTHDPTSLQSDPGSCQPHVSVSLRTASPQVVHNGATMRVLVVEDDPKTAQWLRLYLERDGLEVSTVADGGDALRIVDDHPPDLLLVDVMVPGINGFELCAAVRAGSKMPVMLITARASEADRLRGFEVGADDYITKPFSPREVVARVRAVLRRVQPDDAAPAPVAVGGLTLHPDALCMEAGGRTVNLTPVEARLLGAMMTNPGRPWTRAQLVARALGDDFDGNERTIDAHVKNVRRKLELLPKGATLPAIETAYGVGYRLTCEA
jgi:DNA-binding response OmpR family regulator